MTDFDLYGDDEHPAAYNDEPTPMVLTGTVAEVADRYRNHQCVERWYPIVDLPSLYTHVGVKK